MLTSNNVEKHILNILRAFNQAYNPQTFQKKTFRKIKKNSNFEKKFIFWLFFEFQKKSFFEVGNFKISSKNEKKKIFVIFDYFIEKIDI